MIIAQIDLKQQKPRDTAPLMRRESLACSIDLWHKRKIIWDNNAKNSKS